MVDQYSIKDLTSVVKNVEEKLIEINSIYDQLQHFILILSKEQQNISKDLFYIKNILNQNSIEQDDDEIVPIDSSKSEWDDDDDDDDQIESKNFNENDQEKSNLSLNSSSTDKRLSNLKKSENLFSRIKSPKSVTFSLDENIDQQQQQIESIETLEKNSTEKKYRRFNRITTPIIPLLNYQISKENQFEFKSNINNLTNIRIHEIESKTGDYLRLINLSNSDDYDLTDHFIQQNINSIILCRFTFPSNTIIRAGQTIIIWCGPSKEICPQPPYVFLWKEQVKWDTTSQSITILAKPDGQLIASYKNNPRVNTDQSSSDILFVRSNSHIESSYSSCSSNSSYINWKQKHLSESNIFGNRKPPFAHSPNNPIHPDHNGTNLYTFNHIPHQFNSKGGISKLLHRPKSSPFTSHSGSKQDLITSHLLTTQRKKQTKVQT